MHAADAAGIIPGKKEIRIIFITKTKKVSPASGVSVGRREGRNPKGTFFTG